MLCFMNRGVLISVLHGWAGSNVIARTFDPFSFVNRGVILLILSIDVASPTTELRLTAAMYVNMAS